MGRRVQLAEAIASNAGDGVRAAAGRLDVSDAAPGASGSTGERTHSYKKRQATFYGTMGGLYHMTMGGNAQSPVGKLCVSAV